MFNFIRLGAAASIGIKGGLFHLFEIVNTQPDGLVVAVICIASRCKIQSFKFAGNRDKQKSKQHKFQTRSNYGRLIIFVSLFVGLSLGQMETLETYDS